MGATALVEVVKRVEAINELVGRVECVRLKVDKRGQLASKEGGADGGRGGGGRSQPHGFGSDLAHARPVKRAVAADGGQFLHKAGAELLEARGRLHVFRG